ncbi:putative ribonuclease H-like domain-containing protein, partial [Tanacetum coccineum]
MNYDPVIAGNQTNGDAAIETNVNAGQARQEKASNHEYILLPLMLSNTLLSSSSQSTDNKDADEKEGYTNNTNIFSTINPSVSAAGQGFDNADDQERIDSSSQDVNTAGPSINTASENINTGSSNINTASPIPNDLSMQSLEATGIFDDAYDDREEVGAEADLNNLVTTMNQRRTNHKDYQNCLFACFLSEIEPKEVIQALTDPSWIEAMQEELLQFKLQKVWTLVDLPKGKRAIRTKIEAIRLFLAYASFMGLIVYQMDVKSAFLYGTIKEEVYVCQPLGFEDPQFPDKVYKVEKALYGLHQAPRTWYKTLSTYLLENRYRRGTIDKTLFIKKDRGDILLVHVYVDDIILGSTKKSLCVEFKQMMHKRFHISSMGELTFFLGLQVQQKEDGIFIIQDKDVADILQKFDFTTVKATSTPIETNKALNKDEEAEDVDVHLYRSMIGSLMYLTASRPDIMFVVCACARFQVTPKTSHLHVVKRIFRYLKGQPKLGLWYPRDSPFDLEAFLDSDYAGASLDRKSTTRGCQFLGVSLISWQCKKQTIVSNSTTEAEYVPTANCCGQVLWIQNQMLDYGFNFMNTKIHIDNESTICIVKNLVFHSKTMHIEIRHHFIKDSYEKKLVQVIKIYTDHNVADLLIKDFDVSSGPIHLVADETVYKEWEDRMERATTAAFRSRAGQWFEAASKQSNDPPLSRVNTLGSEEDSMKLMELMEHCVIKTERVNCTARNILILLGKVNTAGLKVSTVRLKLVLNPNLTSLHQMANLDFCDKHNMVAYLQKSEGSEGFHQIIDFLTTSHIRYALTESPTIYVSLIEQFWQTASASTLENGDMEITATIDGKVKVVSEASIRRHLKLEDSDGISTLPT